MTQHTVLSIGEWRMNIRQYLDMIAPDANVGARLGKSHDEGELALQTLLCPMGRRTRIDIFEM